MDRGAGPLYGVAELKRQYAQKETQQGDDQTYLGHHQEPKGMLEETSNKVFKSSRNQKGLVALPEFSMIYGLS